MEFSATQIAQLLDGVVEGNASAIVSGLSKIEEGKTGALSFLSNPKYESYIYQSESSICIVNDTFKPSKPLPSTLTLIKVKDAYACFAKLLQVYQASMRKAPGIEQPCFIDPSATIGTDVYIGAFVYIGANATIGDGACIYPNTYIGQGSMIGAQTTLYSGVQIYDNMHIGSNCIIHAGVVIGSEGFGFAPNEQGVFDKVPQIGNVVIEDHVEIGANTTIDRATMGSTRIKTGVKIDNLCQIAHNVEIGEHTALAAQVGIAGSAKLGKHVMVGGQTGISGHLHIADGTKIVAQSGVPSSVKEAEILMGTPAIPINDFKRSYIGFRKLPEMMRELSALKKEINELKANNS
jgi:UDP-3-O-[3-hydroxymyristoyl] glucosamine N-acyltransferase